MSIDISTVEYIRLFAPLGSLIVIGAIYLVSVARRNRRYKHYLKIAAPLSGKEAAFLMMQRAGYEAKFAISPQTKTLDPFNGNLYLPDENIFIMKREIMDGKSAMSFCIGCQLAASAIKYLSGNINIPGSGMYMGHYGIKYIFNKQEAEKVIPKISQPGNI